MEIEFIRLALKLRTAYESYNSITKNKITMRMNRIIVENFKRSKNDTIEILKTLSKHPNILVSGNACMYGMHLSPGHKKFRSKLEDIANSTEIAGFALDASGFLFVYDKGSFEGKSIFDEDVS